MIRMMGKGGVRCWGDSEGHVSLVRVHLLALLLDGPYGGWGREKLTFYDLYSHHHHPETETCGLCMGV